QVYDVEGELIKSNNGIIREQDSPCLHSLLVLQTTDAARLHGDLCMVRLHHLYRIRRNLPLFVGLQTH
ncbi:hypothetical protein PMAYCL1PPCAC_29663, partial [Pristionchus mayeri]